MDKFKMNQREEFSMQECIDLEKQLRKISGETDAAMEEVRKLQLKIGRLINEQAEIETRVKEIKDKEGKKLADKLANS